jgi:hypothetical protein
MITRFACSLLIIISGGLLIGCQSVSPSQNVNSQNRSTPKSGELDEAEIIKLVVTFSGDEDEESAEAWKKLSSYPPQQLTGKLVQISRSLPEDDHHRVLIAFVLCNLNYDYQTNREVVASSLSEKSRYQHFDDWAAGLIYKLFEKGDKELLPLLFIGTKWSDGAFSTSLSGYLTKSFTKDPNFFLLKLREQPKTIRNHVYDLFFRDEMLTEDDRKQIKAQLQAVPKKSDLSQVAQEMLTSSKNG